MQKFNTKTIITGAGALLLLLAGTLTMLFMPSDENSKSQNQIIDLNPQPSIQVSQPQLESIEPEPVKVWYVYVTGAVKSPGVYKLSEDSRIFQAIYAAGGFTSKADDTSLNLAELLADGVHIHVATKGEKSIQTTIPGVPSVNVNAVKSTRILTTPSQYSGNFVDINHASEIELQKLNGIGPAMAKRIIEYRQTHGAFSKPEDLLKVRGIGQATLSKMRSQISMSSGSVTTQINSAQNINGLIDINHASEIELQKLNGIGPAMAKRIIEYRQTHGAFSKPEDLLKVRGIGQVKLKNMRSQIRIR